MFFYLFYLSQLATLFWLLDRFVTPISAAWMGFGLAFLNFRQLKQIFGVQRPTKVKIKAKRIMRGSPEKLAKAFCKVHCSTEQPKEQNQETYQI